MSREEKRKLKKKERKKKQRQQIACERIQIGIEEDNQEVNIETTPQEPKTVIEEVVQKTICEKCNNNKVDYICHDCKCFYCVQVVSNISHHYSVMNRFIRNFR